MKSNIKNETKSQKSMHHILSKWLELQKVTKEGITLEDISKLYLIYLNYYS